jgi:acyl dehydratase
VATLVVSRVGDRESLQQAVGKEYYSGWFQVTQGQIDAFAAATGDLQYIHREDARPTGSPFREPIAHGLLMVSLCISLSRDCGALPDATWVLCGFDNLRFRAAVRSGSRVRCLTTIQDVRELSGRVLAIVQFVMEIEGKKIPALVTGCSLLAINPMAETLG